MRFHIIELECFHYAKEGGFFVESGGFDGESYSNSLFLERVRGWSGLLIEADLENYQRMQKRNRRAYTSHTCLSPTPHPKKVSQNIPKLVLFYGRIVCASHYNNIESVFTDKNSVITFLKLERFQLLFEPLMQQH